MPDQPRPVWLTREQRDALAIARRGHTSLRVLRVIEDLLAAWDAAPADATEAVKAAITGSYQGQHTGSLSSPKPTKPEDFEWFVYPDRTTDAVLRALGMPGDWPMPKPPPYPADDEDKE